MKTIETRILLCISVLLLPYITNVKAQNRIFDILASENCISHPSLCCFTGGFADLNIRNNFLTKELTDKQLTLSYVRNKDNIQAMVQHYGYSAYGMFRLAAGYGRNFGNKFAITMKVHYILEHARDYNSRHSLCFDVSLCCFVSKKTALSASIYNPFKLNYGISSKNPIPMHFKLLALYLISDRVSVNILTEKQLPGGWEIGGGIHFKIINPLSLAINCTNTYAGLRITLHYKKLLFYVSTSWHYKISISPQLGSTYFFNTTF